MKTNLSLIFFPRLAVTRIRPFSFCELLRRFFTRANWYCSNKSLGKCCKDTKGYKSVNFSIFDQQVHLSCIEIGQKLREMDIRAPTDDEDCLRYVQGFKHVDLHRFCSLSVHLRCTHQSKKHKISIMGVLN